MKFRNTADLFPGQVRKIDLLSQRSLGVLRDTLDKVERLHRVNNTGKNNTFVKPANIFKLNTRD